jgi:Flp pilus assembly protein TadG
MFRTQRSERQRGATAVIVALLLTVLCGFMALVINSGHLGAVRGQLQNATDAAALAGVRELNGTPEGVVRARDFAFNYALEHITDRGEDVRINRLTDVVIGRWDFTAPRADAFTPITGLTAADLAQANAVLVNAGREASRGNSVKVTMGGLLGKEETDVSASSVAVLGGPIQACVIPLAFSSCAITDLYGTPQCDKTLIFHSDLNDTIGFTNLAPDASVNTADLKTILTDGCRTVSTDQPISVSNGANLQPLVGLWPMDPQEVQAPVVELPDCKFNSHDGGTKVIGFVTIIIKSVTPAPDLSITIDVKCDVTLASAGGGGNFGTTATQPRLVR